MVFAVQVHEPTRKAGRNPYFIPPYKRGVTGSNPVAPTRFLQLDGLFETLIGDLVTTAGNHRCCSLTGEGCPAALAAVHRGGVDDSRSKLKPEIPVAGAYPIPLRDEIELGKRP
jgi:hypothetical protein